MLCVVWAVVVVIFAETTGSRAIILIKWRLLLSIVGKLLSSSESKYERHLKPQLHLDNETRLECCKLVERERSSRMDGLLKQVHLKLHRFRRMMVTLLVQMRVSLSS